MVPFPRFRIDRLADRAENPDAGKVAFLDPLAAEAHERTDGRRGGVELVHAVLLAHLPEARLVGIRRNALEHQRCRAVGERAVDDIAVPGHPSDIRRAPVDVSVAVIEHVQVGVRGVHQVSPRRVDDALRRAGRPRRVEDEQRILGSDLDRAAFRRRLRHQGRAVMVASPRPFHVAAGPPDHEHGNAVRADQRFVGVRLQGGNAPPSRRFVRGNHQFRARVHHAAPECLGAESSEHH